METVQAVVDIGLQVSDIVRTEGKIAATKSATEALNRAGTKELAAAKTEWQKANPDKTPTQDDIVQQLYQTSYNKAMLDSGKGTGGALQQGISAATAAASALAGGNLSAAVAGGAAPYLAELIHKATTTKDANGKEVVNVEANLIAHAVLGAAVAQASGGSALAGASGGAAGEYIAQQLYPGVDRKDLSEEQRQTISALGTLAAGLAGGLAGDSAGSAVTGAQAGKNALENNNLLLPRPVVVPVPGLPLSPGDKVVQNANNNIASAFDKALNGAGIEVDTPPVTDGPSIVEARDEAARSRNSNMTLNQQHTDEAGRKTETVPVNDDLTGGKLVNPAQEESKGTWLVTPDRSGEQAASNTGNTEGAPDTGGSSTVTPIPEQNKDDLVYAAESYEPNKSAVGNIGEFFKQPGFGSEVKEVSNKTSKQYQGQSVYKANKSIGDFIKKGDQFYLDAKHKDHMELFDSTGTKVKAVLNLDGSFNDAKTKTARAEGRRLPK